MPCTCGYTERELKTLTGHRGRWVVVRRGCYVERCDLRRGSTTRPLRPARSRGAPRPAARRSSRHTARPPAARPARCGPPGTSSCTSPAARDPVADRERRQAPPGRLRRDRRRQPSTRSTCTGWPGPPSTWAGSMASRTASWPRTPRSGSACAAERSVAGARADDLLAERDPRTRRGPGRRRRRRDVGETLLRMMVLELDIGEHETQYASGRAAAGPPSTSGSAGTCSSSTGGSSTSTASAAASPTGLHEVLWDGEAARGLAAPCRRRSRGAPGSVWREMFGEERSRTHEAAGGRSTAATRAPVRRSTAG